MCCSLWGLISKISEMTVWLSNSKARNWRRSNGEKRDKEEMETNSVDVRR